jgi:phosphoribosylamine--glycine ligase/phosphoribosylformylglycinamidine cyclo-ligase
MVACTERRLDAVKWDAGEERHAVSVVLASEGYPGSYPKGRKIEFGEVPEGEFGGVAGGELDVCLVSEELIARIHSRRSCVPCWDQEA